MHRKNIFFLNLLYGRCVLAGYRVTIYIVDMSNVSKMRMGLELSVGIHIIVDPFNCTLFIYKQGEHNNEHF